MRKNVWAEDYILETKGEDYFNNLKRKCIKDKRSRSFYFEHAKELILNKEPNKIELSSIIINEMIQSSGGYGNLTSASSRWCRSLDNDPDNSGYLSLRRKILEG